MTSTILIVDDEPNNLDVLNNCLHNAGFKVLAATSGKMAIKRVAYLKPDLILLDVNMPGIDGFETCRRLRENEITKDTPIIFVTALTDIETKLKAFRAGGVDYITKRSAAKVMVEAVRKVSQKQQFIGQEMQHFLVKNNNDLFELLSPREFEVFLLLAEGKSIIEIADIMTLSSKTIGHHSTNLKKKLKINNIVELTKLAIRKGFLKI